MTITIGRCVLPDPSSVQASGASVTFAGFFHSTATDTADRADEAQMREMQLLGLVDNADEDTFPLVWDAESRYDGYYTVQSASWDWVNDGSGRLATANWSVSLTRALDGPNALVEMSSLFFIRSNGHSLLSVNNNDVIAHPASVSDYELRFLPDSTLTRSSTEGNVRVWLKTTSAAASGILGLLLTPDAWYDAACRVEYQAGDNNWYPVIGRDIPADAAGRWRLTNGTVRVTPSSTLGVLTLEVFNGTAWEGFDFQGNTYQSATHVALNLSASQTAWLTPAILRNSPDGVAITTAAYGLAGATEVRYSCTLSLTRGTHHVEVVLQGPNGYPGLRAATNTASTALATSTAGVRATSNDANGNRFVLMGANAVTNDTTNGRIYVNSGDNTARAFGAALELDGSSAVTGNASADLLGQFLGVSSIETRVVKR